METPGIKEIQELLSGITLLIKDAKEIMKDGKVDLADLPVAMGVLQQLPTLTEAFTGLSDIGTEVKNLTLEECQAIVQQIFDAAKEIQAA